MVQAFGYHWDKLETKLREMCNCSHIYIIFIEKYLRLSMGIPRCEPVTPGLKIREFYAFKVVDNRCGYTP